MKIEGSVWYTIYHHLPIVKGVCYTPLLINQPIGIWDIYGHITLIILPMGLLSTPIGPGDLKNKAPKHRGTHGVFIVIGVPQHGWFIRENPIYQ